MADPDIRRRAAHRRRSIDGIDDREDYGEERVKVARCLRRAQGEFRAFLTIAVDVASHHEVAASMYLEGLKLKLCELNEHTGEMKAKVLAPDTAELVRALTELRK